MSRLNRNNDFPSNYLLKRLFCEVYYSLSYKPLGNIKIMMLDIKLTMLFEITRYGHDGRVFLQVRGIFVKIP